MPELPEVETTARDLARVLPGRVLAGARVDWPRQVPGTDPAALDRDVCGRSVVEVARRGKYVVVRLSAGWLLFHLKMSGSLQVVGPDAPPDPHVHVAFPLAGGGELRLRDPRKFGRAYLVDDPETVLGRLGPEPLDEGFSAEALRAGLARRRRRLKPLLVDQTFLAGLGNIYVDEALWAAGLHPLRRSDRLSAAEAGRLYDSIRRVLAAGILARGTSLSRGGFRDLAGNYGEMQASLAVFRRTGQPCPRCGESIVHLVVGGRSTHICPACQAPEAPI